MTELKPSSLEKSYLERLAGMLEPVPEVAGRLGVSRQRVLMLIREGKLEAAKLEQDYFVSSLSLQEMLDRKQNCGGSSGSARNGSARNRGGCFNPECPNSALGLDLRRVCPVAATLAYPPHPFPGHSGAFLRVYFPGLVGRVGGGAWRGGGRCPRPINFIEIIFSAGRNSIDSPTLPCYNAPNPRDNAVI